MLSDDDIVKKLTAYLDAEYKPALERHGGSDAKFLLLHCIDYRYPQAIHRALDAILPRRYDQVALAGAALAGVIDFGPTPKPHWSQTLLEHVQLAMTLPHHEISSILVLEHRTCGAYEKFGLLDPSPPEQHEADVHAGQVCKFAELVAATYPGADLYIAGYLLGTSGHEWMDSDRDFIRELYTSPL